MRDWAVCTIGTTARLEINRFEKACAFEPYGSQCRLIPTRRRALAAAKTATPGGWPHLRIGNLLSEHFPGTFCIVANDNHILLTVYTGVYLGNIVVITIIVLTMR